MAFELDYNMQRDIHAVAEFNMHSFAEKAQQSDENFRAACDQMNVCKCVHDRQIESFQEKLHHAARYGPALLWTAVDEFLTLPWTAVDCCGLL